MPHQAPFALRVLEQPATGWWVALGVYCGLIFFQSAGPLPEGADLTKLVSDKALHLVGYAVWAILAWCAMRAHGWPRRPWRRALLAALGAALYGLSDEFHQSWVPGRFAELQDWIADALGGALGALVVTVLERRLLGRARSSAAESIAAETGARSG
jgi:VanZ family protein